MSFVDYESQSRVYWEKSYEVEKSDFKKYETLLGGEAWGHVIIVAGAEVPQYGNDTYARMKLRFETAKGAVFEDEDTFFM